MSAENVGFLILGIAIGAVGVIVLFWGSESIARWIDERVHGPRP